VRIIVVGAGGVGFWLIPALLRAGHEVTVYDDDDFSGGSGHLRLPKVGDPTTRKVTYLRGFTLAVMGDLGLTPVPQKFNGDEVSEGDLVVDCSDMPLTARKVIWARARELGARCIRVSYDGKDNTVVVAEGLPLAGRKLGGYGEIPSLALSLVAGGVGATAVMKILSGWTEHIDFRVSLGDHFPEPVVEAADVKGEREKPKRKRK
jgi:ThiF family